MKAAPVERLLAWLVHAYTALGLFAAGGMACLIVVGTHQAFCEAFLLMLVAVLVDATDGTLARWARVKEVLPGFDGRRLDDLIDFQTYTALPLFLIWRSGLLPEAWAWLLFLPLVASAYGFSQRDAKTDDGFFLGFPSYWNLIAFYLYVLAPPPAISAAILIGFAVLTFVPSRYLYPTQQGKLNRLTNLLGGLWTVLLLVILYRLHEAESTAQAGVGWLVGASLFFPVYYLLASWWVTLLGSWAAR